tara:strand:+ start:49 stop:699 length:651 start_codon:yes stop_codon:yes gene_type:complete
MGRRSPNAQRIVPVMPVLLDEEKIPLDRSQNGTKFGGTACEYSMATFLLSQRINCAEPIIDEGADLLVDRGDKWEKAQVKKVVYCKKLDSGMLKNSGKRVYREDFKFQFQGGGGNVSYLKNGRRQRTIHEIDLFYHVLFTCYRTLIWEIPASIVPLREDGKTFVHCVSSGLVRDNWKRKPAAIDLNKHLIYTRYDPIIFQHYPDFFNKKSTLEPFF